MNSWLLHLMVGIVGQAESLVLAAIGQAEKVLTTDLHLFGHVFEVDLTLRKKG